MNTTMRAVLGLLGLLVLTSALRWIFDPSGAAAALGVTLPAGLGRSTIIGDLGAFFLAGAAFLFLAIFTARAHWLWAAATLFGGAATMRTLAWALHGADFAAAFIAVEIVTAALLLFAASRLS